MSVKGGRAWTYDKIRKECYLHQLERDKPDLNLRNSDVRQELEVCFIISDTSWFSFLQMSFNVPHLS